MLSLPDKTNAIIAVGGANQNWKEDEDLPLSWKQILFKADILLIQRELPDFVNLKAINEINDTCKVILDMGGSSCQISEFLLREAHVIIQNRFEMQYLLDFEDFDHEIDGLLNKHPKLKVICLRGEDGSILFEHSRHVRQWACDLSS